MTARPQATDVADVIRTSQVVVRPERYAYLRTVERPAGPAFMVSHDGDETTAVVREADVPQTPHSKIESWFRMLEIRVSQPFIALGFLAAITRAIADRGLNVLVISTFSKDYVLVRDDALEIAVEALRELGFPVTRSVE